MSQCQKKSSSRLYGAREDNTGRHTNKPNGRHSINGQIRDPPPSSLHFYAGCPSFRNPPALSWLETGTKYAGLHTQIIINNNNTQNKIHNLIFNCNVWWCKPCLKKRPTLACYNFDAHEWILIFFGTNVTDKAGNQKTLYYATSNNFCFCTTWHNAETRKSHISLNWIVLHTQCTCVLSSWKKKLSCVMCLIASNICWDSKVSH